MPPRAFLGEHEAVRLIQPAGGIEALESYRYSDDNYPRHDTFSHYADALRCVAEALSRGLIVAEGWIPAEYLRRQNRPTHAVMGFRGDR